MNAKQLLLTENRKALQAMHQAKGFDFEKDFILWTFPGKFTFNQIKKGLESQLAGKYTAVILVKPNKKHTFNKLYYAELGATRFLLSDHRTSSLYKYGIDHPWGVGYFEEIRKEKTERVFVIAQKTEYLTTPAEKEHLLGETRYKIAKNGIHKSGDGRGNSWINRVELLSPTGRKDCITHEIPRYPYSITPKTDNILEYFDKSGYYVPYYREELSWRLGILKAERAAAELAAYDFTKEENNLKEQLNQAKRLLIAKIETAETEKDFRYIETFSRVLARLFRDVDCLHQGRGPKTLKLTLDVYTYTTKKIQEAMEELKND